MPKWGIFNASLFLSEHPLFYFKIDMINIQRAKFEQKSIRINLFDSFICLI